MMELTEHNILLIGVGAAIAVCTVYLVLRSGRRKKKTGAAQAARTFRNRVLADLEGLYPVPHSWSDDVYKKFKETVPGIESAAAEFRTYVPPEKKTAFDEALKSYCKHCSEITWQSCATFGVISEMSNHDDVGPKEIFRQNVNALLSFPKEV